MDLSKVIRSGTPNAIIVSALTTVASFSTLAVSSHNGTSSMGILFIYQFINDNIILYLLYASYAERFKKTSSGRNKF